MDGEKMIGPVLICRCNDITLNDLIKAIEMGIDSFELLRKYLKLGFGPCQGRGCLMIAARIFAKRTGKSVGEVLSSYKVRPPIIPVPAKYFLVGGD
ncbi:MAG: (2Fe-2S)-binding protein [Desulfurococcaceae archaeon]